jgi:hypothetical protein
MTDEAKKELIESAEHWEKLAQDEAKIAEWNRLMGFDSSLSGQSSGDHRARLYTRAAKSLRLEVATGEEHCMCDPPTPKRMCPILNKDARR